MLQIYYRTSIVD